jgi:hypothetical protein
MGLVEGPPYCRRKCVGTTGEVAQVIFLLLSALRGSSKTRLKKSSRIFNSVIPRPAIDFISSLDGDILQPADQRIHGSLKFIRHIRIDFWNVQETSQ